MSRIFGFGVDRWHPSKPLIALHNRRPGGLQSSRNIRYQPVYSGGLVGGWLGDGDGVDGEEDGEAR